MAAPVPPPNDPNTAYLIDPTNNPDGIRVSKYLFNVARVIVAVSLALFAITIVFLCLSTAQKIPPMIPIYSFAAFGVTLIFLAIMQGIQRRVAKRYGIDFNKFQNAMLGRLPNPAPLPQPGPLPPPPPLLPPALHPGPLLDPPPPP